jgi:hypothetical protein
MSQNHTEFRPAWYDAELARLQDQRCDCAETWTHPTDVLIAIAAVVVVTLLFLGAFK